MRPYIIIALLLLRSLYAGAQLEETGKSEIFDEPRTGFVKIIQSEAVETYYIHIGNEGLLLKKYGSDHKLVKSKKVKSKFGDLHRGNLLSITCRDGAITLFTSELEDRAPALYRQVIDAGSLEIRDEALIDSMPKIKIKFRMGKISERELNRKFEFYVKTDPATGSYATAAYYTDEETNRQVRITHYNREHKVLSSSGFYKAEGQYSFYDYRDMYVDGEKAVVVMASGSSGKTGDLLMGVLDAGASSFRIREIQFEGAKDIKSALITYNPVMQQYMAISVSEKSGDIVSAKTVWNPGTDKESTEIITGATLVKGAKAGKGSMLKPVVQQLLLQPDGTYILIFEDMKHDQNQYAFFSTMGGHTMMKSKTSNKFYLNNLAIVQYDATGNLQQSDVLQKSFQVTYPIQLSYRNSMEEAGVTLAWGLQFKSFFFVNGKTKKYLIFNDDEQNQERLNSNKKPETIQGLEHCAAYLLPVHAGTDQQRQPLFSEPVTKQNRQLVVAAASGYHTATGELALLKVNYADKKARIVWMKAD